MPKGLLKDYLCQMLPGIKPNLNSDDFSFYSQHPTYAINMEYVCKSTNRSWVNICAVFAYDHDNAYGRRKTTDNTNAF